MSKAQQLATVLDEFLSVSFDVEAAAVVSSDGLPMASALPPDIQEDRLAAMSAALLSLGERAAQGLDKGELAQVYVEGAAGNVVLMAAGRHAVLVAMTAKNAKAGLVLYEMRSSSRRIEQILEEPVSYDGGYERDDAVSQRRVDSSPAPPPEERPYTAVSEGRSPDPQWEDQAVQATPDWETQPAPEPAPPADWVERAEETPGEGSDQWPEQQTEGSHQEDRPQQRDDEPRDENSSFTSW